VDLDLNVVGLSLRGKDSGSNPSVYPSLSIYIYSIRLIKIYIIKYLVTQSDPDQSLSRLGTINVVLKLTKVYIQSFCFEPLSMSRWSR